MHPSYIGITGFMHRTEVDMAKTRLPFVFTRKLMVGVLASSKTLAGQPNTYPNRYPLLTQISTIFSDDQRMLNLIHYVTDDSDTLGNQLEIVRLHAGHLLHGFQLNVTWPDPKQMAKLVGMRVVLELGKKALEQVGNNYRMAAIRLKDYKGLITDVLIDSSGGKGIKLDVSAAIGFVEILADADPTLGVGVAGGLSADTLGELNPLLVKFPHISVDAEGKLRNDQDHLDFPKMRSYLDIALDVCKAG